MSTTTKAPTTGTPATTYAPTSTLTTSSRPRDVPIELDVPDNVHLVMFDGALTAGVDVSL